MGSDCRSFEEFWTVFTREQRPFRLGRAGVALARLTIRQRGPERWRWAVAAAVLTAGKLLAGTFDDDADAYGSEEALRDDARSLASGAREVYARAAGAPRADVAWAAWM